MGRMNKQYDVIVIGGGIAGISAAAEIAAHCKVGVLEMEDQPGYHATGRSAAYFAPSYGNRVVRGVTSAAEHFFKTPPAGFCETELIKSRSAVFIAREDQKDSLEKVSIEQPGLQLMDGKSLSSWVPILDPNYVSAGLRDNNGGDIDVNSLLQAYLKLLRQRGGAIHASHPVKGLKRSAGLWNIVTSQQEFAAPLIVNAAGAWADDIAGMAGLAKLGLQPKRRSVLLIDKPQDHEIDNWPLVVDVDEEFYFKPDAGQLLISPANEDPSNPCDSRPEELELAIGVDRFEKATGYEVKKINHSWAGLRTFAPDKTFVVGFDPGCDGFFWLAGQGGYGVQSAPGLAQLCMAILLGESLSSQFKGVLEFRDDVDPGRLL